MCINMIEAQTSKQVMEIQVGMLVSSWGLSRGWNNGSTSRASRKRVEDTEIFQGLEEKKKFDNETFY